MKKTCKECDCCRKGFFKSKPEAYVCIGAKNPFEIKDINAPCTESREPKKKPVMTESEAIDYLLSRYLVVGSPLNPPKEECESHNDALDLAIHALEAYQAYKAIGTVDRFKELTEKAEPKKAIVIISRNEAICPTCHEVVSDDEFWALDEGIRHCEHCGQAILGSLRQ